MTSYWKPRWKNTVLFGSYRELGYRIDIGISGRVFFRLRTNSGPGFSVELVRDRGPDGFAAKGPVPAEAQKTWIENHERRRAVADLLASHFSSLNARPETIECLCHPEGEDILPEGPQLNWCLSLVYDLWSAIPAERRRAMSKSDFME